MTESTTADSFTPSQNNDSRRLKMCLQAVWELDTIAKRLPGMASNEIEDDCILMVRAMSGRMLRLTKSLMEGLGENAVSTDELARVVTLEGASTQG